MSPLWMFRSRLGALNFCLLQWFGVRLARVVDADDNHLSWTWLGFVLPLTGWWSDYIWIWKKGPARG